MQLLLKFDHENRVVLHVPLEQRIRQNAGLEKQIELRFGYGTMLHLSNSHAYGDRLGDYLTQETKRLKQKNNRRQRLLVQSKLCAGHGDKRKALRIMRNNLGQQKYTRQKRRADEAVKSYINAQINKMIASEKPGEIIIPKR